MESKFNDTKIKRLPRDENGKIARFFKANGKDYKICEWENGVPIDRWSAYEKWALMFTYNASPAELVANQRKTGKILNRIMAGDDSVTALDVIAHLKSMSDGIITLSNQKFTRAMWLCSIFIIQEGEDVRTWDSSLADSKIMDWIKEGFSVEDFFTLAQTISIEFSKNLAEFIKIGLSENGGQPIRQDDGTEIGKL